MVEVGPMSGKSNARCYLERLGVSYDDGLLDAIVEHAKRRDRILSERDVRGVISQWESSRAPSRKQAV
jgi:hypothetical protein